MYYVGVDIAKNSHVASIMDNHGVVHLEALKFENNHVGFSRFLDSISEFPKEELIIEVIGNFQRFSSPRKLNAYAGLDAVVYESGQFKARSTRMSKRGNSLLRQHLVLAAHNIVKNNETFKAYYDSKRDQGKTHYNALGHCATKLLRIMYKLECDQVTFNL